MNLIEHENGIIYSDVLSSQNYRNELRKVLSVLSEVLSNHYGPYSKFALLANLDNPIEEPRFTKDGIGIINTVQFENPVHEYFRNVISYIGKRVEQSIGDGTTSAMLIIVKTLELLLERKAFEAVDFRTVQKGFELFLEEFIDREEEFEVQNFSKLTGDERKSVIGNIAYAQAYTSSHGDIELAECIQELFTNAPEETWDYMTFMRETLETKKVVRLEYEDCQFNISIDPYKPSMMNADAGLSYTNDEVNLVLFPTGIDPKAPIAYRDFCLLLKKACTNEWGENDDLENFKDKKWLFLIPNIHDASVNMSIEDILNSSPGCEKRVAIFTHYIQNPVVNDYVALCYVSDMNYQQVLTQQGCMIIPKIRAYSSGRNLKLDRLYKNEEDSATHPNAKTQSPLKNQLDYIERVMEQLKVAKVSNNQIYKEYDELQKHFNKLYLAKRANVIIGGTSYDNATTVDIVKDVILATRTSLKNGIVCGGNMTMLRVLLSMFEDIQSNSEHSYDTLEIRVKNYFTVVFYQVLTEITVNDANAIIDYFLDVFDENVGEFEIKTFEPKIITWLKKLNPGSSRKKNDTRQNYAEDEFAIGLYSFDQLTGKVSDITDIFSDKFDGKLVVQPSTTNREILKRFSEVALKLVKTSELVSPNYCHKLK